MKKATSFIRAAALAAVVLGLAFPARAQAQGAQIEQAPRDEPSVEQVTQTRTGAAAGNAHAQFMLGMMNMMGKGMPANPQEGATWLTKSAEQGHTQAQFILGLAYGTDAMGLAVDKDKARHWLGKAAEGGNPKAAEALTMLDNAGPSEDIETLAQKADAGDSAAQYLLGSRYVNGWGVAKDDEKGLNLILKAAENGDELAQSDAGVHLVNRGHVAEGVKWMEMAAKRGVVNAQRELGQMYASGELIAGDRAKAVFWLDQAARQGDQESARDLQALQAQPER